MCGIIGVFGPEADNIKENRIKKSLNLLKHRGPDATNVFKSGNCFLGHTRLSIIDTRGVSNQPMQDDENRLVIVYNGEIYNFKELKEELSQDYVFNTNSDTEVILNAYKEWGEKCVDKFIGMWAFAIFDKEKNKMFLSRDRIGEKPVYYYLSGNTLYFSSELPALLELKEIDKEIDFEALTYYFTYNVRHIPWDKTIYRKIRKVPPAHNLIFNGEKIDLKRYWKPSFKKEKRNKRQYLEEYEKILRKATGRGTVSDVPLGVLLSGGIDSTSIALMLKDKKTVSYTIGIDRNDPEIKRAKKVAEKLKLKNKKIFFSSEEIIENGPKLLRKLIKNLGEPINLLQPLYTHLITREVKKDGIKVLLGGNSADEVFYGYDGVGKSLLVSRILWLVDKTAFLKKIKLSKLFKGKMKEKLLFIESENSYRKPLLYKFHAKESVSLFTDKVKQKVQNKDFSDLPNTISKVCDSNNFLEASQWLGLTFENEHSITIVGDLGGMTNSVEIRSPFLDKEMVEFGFRLPVKYKVRSMFSSQKNKWIMRKFLEKKLGKEFLYKKKMGFGYNIKPGELIKKEWKKDFEEVVFKYLPKQNIFDMKKIRKLYKEHLVGKDHNKTLLGIYAFGIWHREYGEKNV